jgi:AcrR family transcriptional regulator
VTAHGLAELTMDGLAEAAGVGKGTIYRAFGDRSGVAQALVDDAERALQEAILTGPPPLGPGAEPAERVAAFADAYLRVLARDVELFVEVDHRIPGRRFTVGAYGFWRAHLATEGERDGLRQPGLTAELVLGLLAADLQRHLAAGPESATTVRKATVAAVRDVFSGAARRAPRRAG